MRFYSVAAWVVVGTITLPAALADGFDYSVTISSPAGTGTFISTGGTSYLNMNAQSNFTFECGNGGTSVPVATMGLSVGQDVAAPDPFDAAYTVAVKITEYDAGQQGTLTFNGHLRGFVTQKQAALASDFPVATKSITLGSSVFTVTMGPFISPAPPTGTGQGLLAAFVTCSPMGTAVSSVVLDTASSQAGRPVKGTVTLNGPAPVGGAVVALTSSAPASLAVPATAVLPEGASSAVFYGSSLAAGTGIQVHAAWNGSTASAPFSVGAGVCWDVNGDGKVDLQDSVKLLRAVAGLEALPSC